MTVEPPVRRVETHGGLRTGGGTLVAVATLLVTTLYLLNVGFGWLEFVPDNVPLVGNLDEAGATALWIGALRYLRRPRG